MNRTQWPPVVVCCLTLVFVSVSPAYADFVLWNTGVDSTGTPISSDGQQDPHWIVVQSDIPSLQTPSNAWVTYHQGPHTGAPYAVSPNSRWIWAIADASSVPASVNTFRQTFDLTGLDHTTAVITGRWGVDNLGHILLNGQTPIGTGSLSLSSGPTFQEFHSFTITGGFVPGINTLDFVAVDNGAPGALNVNNLFGSASAVPEPSSFALLTMGVSAFCALNRKRRKRT